MQLICLVQTWSAAVDSSNYVAKVFFNLKKAFGLIWHRDLLAKLAAAGVSGGALQWITNYLSGRKQRVSVGGIYLLLLIFTQRSRKELSSALSFSFFISMTSPPAQQSISIFVLVILRCPLLPRTLLRWPFECSMPWTSRSGLITGC